MAGASLFATLIFEIYEDDVIVKKICNDLDNDQSQIKKLQHMSKIQILLHSLHPAHV